MGLFQEISSGRLSHLKKITLENSSISSDDIKSLFKVAPYLEDLNLSGCKAITGAFQEISSGGLSHLKKITLDNSSISSDDIKSLFKVAPYLEDLNLSGCKAITGAFQEIDRSTLSSLKKINLSDSAIAVDDVASLFRAAPNLKDIDLYDCKEISGVFQEMAPSSLPHLKIIDLASSSINPDDIRSLFRVAPHLEEVDLNHCENINSAFLEITRGALPHLKKINLNTCDINADDVTALVRAAPDLEELDLEECEDIEGAFQGLTPGELQHLKLINLMSSPINSDDIKGLFRAAPHLENVYLCSNTNITDSFLGLVPGGLQDLKIFDVSHSSINSADIRALYRAAPDLEEMSLNYCENIAGAFQGIAPGGLPYLQQINLTASSINSADIRALCAAAPNLEEINLTQCKNIAGAFQGIAPDTLLHLKAISLSHSTITQEDVDALFKAAPRLKKTDLNSDSPEHNYQVPSDNTTRCTQQLDERFFDTTLSTTRMLSFKRYFIGIEPALYRLNLWQPELDTLNPPPGIVEAADFVPIRLKEKKDYPAARFICHQGIKSVTTTESNTRIILPSLDAEEELFDLTIMDKTKAKLLKDYIIQHSDNARFYQVILPNPGQFTIQYQVAIPSKKPPLPARLQDILRTYKEYTPQKLPEHQPFRTLKESARYFRTYKTGSCQQRSIAAYDQFFPSFNLETLRIVLNDVHAYIEAKIHGVWIKLDLGGYSVRLKEISMPIVLDVSRPTPVAGPEYPIIESTMAEVMENTQPALVLVNSDVAVKSFLSSFQSPWDLFIAHRPEDLSLGGVSMTQEGIIIPARTRFSEWNKGRVQGIICVDICEFDANELAQLNDLLDGRIEQQILAPGIRILLLDGPDRGYYGPDFRRRVTQKTKVQVARDAALLEVMPTHFVQQPIEIDLFNSSYWHRFLVGSWGMEQKQGDTDFSFRWQQGLLLRALGQGTQHIVLKNPPLHDPSFTAFMAELQGLKRIEWADQTTVVTNEVHFYQAAGYHWDTLSRGISIAQWSGREIGEELPYILSDANILSFIQTPCYEFTTDSNQLTATACYLERCKTSTRVMNVVCAYGLSESTLAQFLTAAQAQEVQVNFLIPTQVILKNSPLSKIVSPTLPHTTEVVARAFSSRVQWQIHHDVEFAARSLLFQKPQSFHFDMAYLEAADLGRFPVLPDEVQQGLLTKGKLSISAPLSELVQKLQSGETVVLSGQIPPTLYETLTSLSLGHIERKAFSGQLVILVPPEETTIAQAIAGQVLIQPEANGEEKIAFLKRMHATKAPLIDEFLHSPGVVVADFVTLERQFLQFQLDKMLTANELILLPDGAHANRIDENRWRDVEAGLYLNPWVMIEGSTGIGKSFFLQHVLPKKRPTVFQLEQWLTSPSTLVLDEASFMSELSGEGAHFLERFKGLRANPPSFLWKGKYHRLTADHKVIFAFNPASYGAGRSTSGFLSEQALHVSFKKLPDFYVKERLIMPLLQKLITQPELDLNIIADPLVRVYRWLIDHSPANEALITPREIKAMVHLIASPIKRQNITDTQTIMFLAIEIAYTIGKQTLDEHPELISQFEDVEADLSPQQLLMRHVLPEQYLPHQYAAYYLIQDMLHARTLLSPENPDLGLGGIVLEGSSGIGKTYFIEQIINELGKEGKIVHRISPSTPFHEKETILRQAFAQGAFVVAEEINTSLWPNKLLNNFLMGLDEEGNHARTPGAMLIATQNPPSFAGRSEEDPARRKRMIKIILDWPVYKPSILQSAHTEAMDDAPLCSSVPPAKLTATIFNDMPPWDIAEFLADDDVNGFDEFLRLESPPVPILRDRASRRKKTHYADFFPQLSEEDKLDKESTPPPAKRTCN